LRAAEAAGVHHPEVAQRVVVLDGIPWIEIPQRRGDVARHRPARAAVARQSQALAHADDVRVERHHQQRGRQAGPHPQIERVAADHPPEKKVQPLAGAPCAGPGEEVPDAWTGQPSSIDLGEVERQCATGETLERGTDVVCAGVQSFEKEILDRP